MNSIYVAVAALFLGVPASAAAISAGPGCPSEACALPQTAPSSASFLFRSLNRDSLGLTQSLPTTILASPAIVSTSLAAPANLTTTSATQLQTQANLFLQNSSLFSLAAPSDPTDLLHVLGVNTISPESKRDPTDGSSATSEPSTLLLLSFGLLAFPFLRKSRSARRALRLRPA